MDSMQSENMNPYHTFITFVPQCQCECTSTQKKLVETCCHKLFQFSHKLKLNMSSYIISELGCSRHIKFTSVDYIQNHYINYVNF